MIDKEGALKINLGDEIIRETLVTHEGKIVNAKVSQLLGETPAVAAGEGKAS
jgi:NAD(P) transhydrogenase subunit alpha